MRLPAPDTPHSDPWERWAPRAVWLWPILLVAIGAVLYYPGIYRLGDHSPYWGDDYQWVVAHPAGKVFYYFSHTSPKSGFYRPMSAAILALIQAHFGMNTWPIAVLNLLLHLVLAYVIFLFCLSQRLTVIQAGLASLFMMVSQANAQAVAENDTTSQVGATVFGCLALYLLHRALIRRPERYGTPWRTVAYWLSIICYVVSLLFKETSLAFLVLTVGVIAVDNWSRLVRTPATALRALAGWLPYLLTTIVYLAARTRAVGSIHPAFRTNARYGLHLGLNVVRNLFEFVVAEWSPVSSVDTFLAVSQRQLVLVAVIALVTLAVMAATVIGIILSPARERWLSAIMLTFSLVAALPALVLIKTSELYVYNAMPFISIAAGIGIGALILGRPRWMVPVAVAALALLFSSNAVAVRGKEVLLRRNGQLAARLLPQIDTQIRDAAPRNRFYLMNPIHNGRQYSEFLVTGFWVFNRGEDIFSVTTGRGALDIKEIPLASGASLRSYESQAVVLTYHPGSLRVRRVMP